MGTITFRQLGLDGALEITTALTQLEDDGNKWHVHQFATFAEGGVDNVGCGPSVTGGHYDPTFQARRARHALGLSPCSKTS